jgi:hypothetical protein
VTSLKRESKERKNKQIDIPLLIGMMQWNPQSKVQNFAEK